MMPNDHKAIPNQHRCAAPGNRDSARWRIQPDALLRMVDHVRMRRLPKWWILHPRRDHAPLRGAIPQWSHTHPSVPRKCESEMTISETIFYLIAVALLTAA